MPWTASDARKKYKKLGKKQSEVWAKVANDALARCESDGGSDCEGSAIRQANAAVNRMRKSEAYSEAQITIAEIGRSISTANMKTLKSSFKAMQDAMKIIAPLIADDTEEESVTESGTNTEWEVTIGEASKILAQSDSYDSIRYAVQSALRKRAISDALTTKAQDGVMDYYDYYDYGCMPYIRDLYDDYVVYSIDGELYQCEYTVSDDTVDLGEPTPVKISYVPTTTSDSSEAVEVEVKGDLIQLAERAVREDGTARVCLITPGWGSSGYYSKEMLKRDGPKVFPKGTHMYMNHPTEEEDRVRPERDIRDLAGVINSDVTWEEASANNVGAGLYADVKVFPTYKDFIDEASAHIGTSIRAAGTAIEGKAENRHGLLIDSLKEGYSVDYVTIAGRGGQVLSLYESARKNVQIDERTAGKLLEVEKGINVDITQEELNALKEAANKTASLEKQLTDTTTALTAATDTISKMQEAFVVSEARALISTTLAAITMPSVVRDRLLVECARALPLNEDRSLNKEKLTENVKERAVAEMKYIESVTGSVTGGRVTGMGQSASTELNAEDVDKKLNEAWSGWGLSEKATKIAATGRIN